MDNTNQPILSVKDLSTSFFLRDGEVKAVDGVSFRMNKGEVLALVGESGSGKTVTALSILRLITWPPGKIKSGSVELDGQSLLDLSTHEMRKVRGSGIAMILQEPMSSLNPSMTIGAQIMEAVEINQGLHGEEAKKKAIEMLEVVRIPSPEKRFYNYPHELSGGMKQRVMIAIALSCRPKVLIADEPTCSLDVTIQAQVLQLMKTLRTEIDTTSCLSLRILVSWRKWLIALRLCTQAMIIEICDVFTLYKNPAHPYTKGITASIMDMKKGGRLNIIPGDPPNLMHLPSGCKFHPRCEYCQEICKTQEPTYTDLSGTGDHWIRCHFPLNRAAAAKKED